MVSLESGIQNSHPLVGMIGIISVKVVNIILLIIPPPSETWGHHHLPLGTILW